MGKVDIVIREAGQADIPKVQAVLVQAQLSTDNILVPGTRYWIVEDDQGQPAGVVGLELGHTAVLLRSAAVNSSCQGQGLGTSLVLHALDVASAAGYEAVYLFSTGAGAYWQRHNFYEVPVCELVVALPHVSQVRQYENLGWLSTEIAWRYDL